MNLFTSLSLNLMALVSGHKGVNEVLKPSMFHRVKFTVFLLTLAIAFVQGSATAPVVGHWRGDARLFHAKTRAKTGTIPAELTLGSDWSLSGRIGGAVISATRPKSRTPTRVEYEVIVSGQVHKELDSTFDHLIIIVTLGSGTGLDADFHLKERFDFTSSMYVGHFDVRRAE